MAQKSTCFLARRVTL